MQNTALEAIARSAPDVLPRPVISDDVTGDVTGEDIARFRRDGFVVLRQMLDAEEVDLLRDIARTDRALLAGAYSRRDGEGGAIRLALANTLEDNVYGAIIRSERVAGAMEALLGDEVYHYHHKLILKDPRVGGAWAWHQDYGYWYSTGCLLPDMGSCMIGVDGATRSNGCLQVLRGSHTIGRIDHVQLGDQVSADPERVAVACERLELVHVELEPGSAVLFHSNLLHRSDQNRSAEPRWAFICAYNTKHNDPYKPARHPGYSPLERWPHERIKEIGRRQLAAARAAAQ